MLKKFIYKLGTPVIKLYWFIFRPATFGVKCIIRRGNEILMIRNTYGKGWWTFPGGGIEKGESDEQAIRREIQEELGVGLLNLKLVGKFLSTVEYKKDNVTVLSAEVESVNFAIQEAEIQEVRWVSFDAPPTPMGRVAKQALSMYFGREIS